MAVKTKASLAFAVDSGIEIVPQIKAKMNKPKIVFKQLSFEICFAIKNDLLFVYKKLLTLFKLEKV
jgi:hypothetical protein